MIDLETRNRPSVGLAYSAGVRDFVRRHGNEVDYVEIPFELLRHDPDVIRIRDAVPVVLHCASLSIAGTEPCSESTVEEIAFWVNRTGTPWLGEHLAFVTASKGGADVHADEYAPGEPYNIGYTVSPVMNGQTLVRIVQALAKYQSRFPVPLLIENSPIYFTAPGSRISQSAFVSAICSETSVGVLLDLSHLVITCRNSGIDPMTELNCWPLDRVVEVHISGVNEQGGAFWDDHARPAPAVVYELLGRVLADASPQAVTLEYNWSSRLPGSLMSDELGRTKAML